MLNKLLITTTLLMTALSASASLNDEIILSSKKWETSLVSQHSVWEKPACVARTLSEDGLSSLEVVAFYDDVNDIFLQPEVNVITPFDVSFLEVTVKADGFSAKTYSMLPVLPADVNTVGARALFSDREDLVNDLRKRNRLTATYLDTAGEVKEITFSLSGSSNAINAQFAEENCDLEFKDLPKELTPVDELP